MKFAYLLIGSLALSACGSDTITNPTIGESGTVAFSYTGAGGASTYNATGAVPVSQNVFGTTSWAAGGKDNASQSLNVSGVVPKTSSSWDMAIITVARLTTGTSPIDPNCNASACTGIGIIFGSNNSQQSFGFLCTLTTGSVTIVSISDTRATGTFSGSGTCLASNEVENAFTITNGTFDVGLTTGIV